MHGVVVRLRRGGNLPPLPEFLCLRRRNAEKAEKEGRLLPACARTWPNPAGNEGRCGGAFGLVLRLSSRSRLSALGLVKIERFVDFDSAEEQVSLDAD